LSFAVTSRILADGRRSQISEMFPRTEDFGFNDPNDRRLVVETAQFEGMQLHRVASSGHWIRLTESDRATYLVPRRGAIEVKTTGDSFSGTAGNAFVFSPNSRTTNVTPAGSQSFRASVMLVDMRELRTFLSLDDTLASPNDIEQKFADRSILSEERGLRDYILFLERELMVRPLAFAHPRVKMGMSALARELFGQVYLRLQATSTELRDSGGLDTVYVKRAEEVMRAKLDEPLTIAQVAADTGVSVRRLQLIFKKMRQTSPREVLTDFRLEKVHGLLVKPDCELSIFQAALDCGFTHLGRFAGAYKKRFGELPSQTLRKTRRAQHE
jgi:AraC-like DNA-binding protein